jgi:hypothetical protein
LSVWSNRPDYYICRSLINAKWKVPREAGERAAYPDVDTRIEVIGPDRHVDEAVVRRVPPCTAAFIRSG